MALITNVSLRGGLSLAIALIVVFALPISGWTQVVESAATGTSGKTYRKQAISRIPYKSMNPAVARKVADVVDSAGLYRQLPVTTINSDPDMYLFLLRYPETIISTWRLMGVSDMTARRSAAFSLDATDGAGTQAQAELVYGQPNLNIYYAEGQYDGPMLFRKVTGKCVIMIESDYRRGPDGQVQVTSRMNFFLKIDNFAASLIAKTIHPLVGTTADHNFVETLKFAEKLSETSGRNGPGVQRMADRLEGLSPDVRRRFQDIAGIVWKRSQPKTGSPTIQAGYNQAVQNSSTGWQPTRGQTARSPARSPARNSQGQYRRQAPTYHMGSENHSGR